MLRKIKEHEEKNQQEKRNWPFKEKAAMRRRERKCLLRELVQDHFVRALVPWLDFRAQVAQAELPLGQA